MVVSYVIGVFSFALLVDPMNRSRVTEVLTMAYGRFTPIIERWYVAPIALLLLLVALGVLLHALAYGYHRSLNIRGPADNDFRLGGSIWDTVNAVLGFSALYLPVYVAITAVSTWLYFMSSSADSLLFLVVSGGAVVGPLFIYLPAALAGTHPETSFGQAILACSVALGGILLVIGAAT
jgi:hypothetical protein